jgi:hypothetical protein
MRDDFRIRLRSKTMAAFLERFFELEVVLDDAIVHDRDLPAAIRMRMGVLLGRFPCVAQRVCAIPTMLAFGFSANRSSRADTFPTERITFSFPSRSVPPGAVISSILQTPKSLKQEFLRRSLSEIPDDAAHRKNAYEFIS